MYSIEFKEQIVKDVQDVGNVSLVCRKHGLKTSTVHSWLYLRKNKAQVTEKKQNREFQKKIKDLELQVEVLTSLLKKNLPTLEQRKATVLEFKNKNRARVCKFAKISRSCIYPKNKIISF